MQNKQKIITIVFMVLLLAGWVSVRADLTDLSVLEPSLTLTKATLKVPQGQAVDPMQWVVSGYFDRLVTPIVDTNTVGIKVITYKAQRGLYSITKQLTIEVEDQQAPTFVESVDEIEIEEGSTIDFNEYFTGKDSVSDVVLSIDGEYDLSEVGEYELKAILTDQSNNTTTHAFILSVKAKPKEVISEIVSTTNSVATQDASGSFAVRMTRYGMDCDGCTNYNGVGYTSTGIALTANSVRQPSGEFTPGITYQGRYIVASSSSHARCELITIYDHPYEGMGITQGQPIYGVIADVGAVGYNHMDLFVGSEHALNVVYIVNPSARPYAMITGLGVFTGSGCAF